MYDVNQNVWRHYTANTHSALLTFKDNDLYNIVEENCGMLWAKYRHVTRREKTQHCSLPYINIAHKSYATFRFGNRHGIIRLLAQYTNSIRIQDWRRILVQRPETVSSTRWRTWICAKAYKKICHSKRNQILNDIFKFQLGSVAQQIRIENRGVKRSSTSKSCKS